MAISLLAAGPAAAGGPTSVLLSAPEQGRVAALHASGSDYHALASYVNAFSNSGEPAPSDTPEGSSGTVTLTWLIHDVQVWRVDTVYLGAEGGPWIASRSSMGTSADLSTATEVWHKVTDPQRLTALLTKLGVNPLAPAATSPASSAGEAAALAPAPTAVTTPAPATVAPERESATPAWMWGLIGLVAGMALAAASGLVWSRRRLAETSETKETTPEVESSPKAESSPAETITV